MVCLGLDVVVVDVDGTVLDPVVGSAYACLQEGGWGVVAFVPLSFVFLAPRCLLLSMPVSSSIVDMEVHAPGQIPRFIYPRPIVE